MLCVGNTFFVYIFSNGQGDPQTCSTIANQFVSNNVDLILANATPALQSAAAATAEIPILGTSVTEYGVALNLEGFDGTVGGNISGTSDLAPLDKQAAMITEWCPDAKTVGLLYCSKEAKSQYQVDVVQTVITLGLDANLLKLLSAVIVAIFLAIPYWKRQHKAKRMVKNKGGKVHA